MVTLIECSSTRAGEVKDLLDNDGSISYQMSDDGLTPPRRTRPRNTSCIWRIISQISWRHCQTSRARL
ncbi:MAG: hypothetical protein ACLU9O_05915 [Roseburia hominis]